MSHAANIVVLLVALEHAYFALLEIVMWEKPLGLKSFGNTPASAAATARLAKNMGTYNLFLSAGLVWSLIAPPEAAAGIRLFFLGCVVIAGIVGAVTVSPRILLVQALPAALGLSLAYFS